MSLNWREIDAALLELDLPGSFIQDVVQPDFRNICFSIFRPGARFYLRVALETGKTRLHSTAKKPRKPKKRQRFAQVLHSRVKGAHITDARQVNSDRIVRVDLRRGDEELTLWIRLWGGASNAILTDTHGTVIDAFFRRPKKGEVSGGHYFISDAAEARPKESFVARWTENVNEEIESYYDSLEHDEELAQLRAQSREILERRLAAAAKRARSAKKLLGAGDESGRLRDLGDLLTANLYQIESGTARVEVDDYTNDGALTVIELDPSKSPQENARAYYDRAQRAERKSKNAQDEMSSALAAKEAAEKALESLETTDHAALRSLISGEKPRQSTGGLGSGTPGLTAQSGDFTILIGRNSRENDELLRRHVRGNDLWLHTRDYPGGYVFVRSRAGKSVPLEVLLDAGNLAIHYSKAKTNGRADLFYTQVKYLRRAKDGPKGLVIPTQEKNLHVVTEESRVNRLLGRTAE